MKLEFDWMERAEQRIAQRKAELGMKPGWLSRIAHFFFG